MLLTGKLRVSHLASYFYWYQHQLSSRLELPDYLNLEVYTVPTPASAKTDLQVHIYIAIMKKNFLSVNFTCLQEPRYHVTLNINRSGLPESNKGQDSDEKKLVEKFEKINRRRMHENLCYFNECTWFYGEMSHIEAQKRLINAKVGSFLIRYSGHPDPKYSFSISLKTKPDTTKSMRIVLQDGLFYFSSLNNGKMLRFPYVLELIQFYMPQSPRTDRIKTNSKQTFAELLISPLWHSPPKLTHLCRLEINRTDSENNRVRLGSVSRNIRYYLESYPFFI